MFCSQCGSNIQDGSKFCNQCGFKIDGGNIVKEIDVNKIIKQDEFKIAKSALFWEKGKLTLYQNRIVWRKRFHSKYCGYC